MVRVGVIFVLVLTVTVNQAAGLDYWNFWSKFTPTWVPLIPNSYNIQRSVNVTDSNHDGYITRDEILADVKRFDANGDGRLTRYEYVRYHVQEYESRVDTAVARFDSADSNRDNYLTQDDLGMLDSAMRLMDANNDNRLSVYEFQVALRQADLKVQTDVQCSPTFVYHLPPADLKHHSRKCQYLARKKEHLS